MATDPGKGPSHSERALEHARNYFGVASYAFGALILAILGGVLVKIFGDPGLYENLGGKTENKSKPEATAQAPTTSTRAQAQKPPTVLVKIQTLPPSATPAPALEKTITSISHQDQPKEEVEPKFEILEMNGRSIVFRRVQINKNTFKLIAILPFSSDSLATEELDKSETSKSAIKAKAERTHVKAWTYHYVQPGDSLLVVAQKYGVTKAALMEANYRVNSISRRGEWLIIPMPDIYSKENFTKVKS